MVTQTLTCTVLPRGAGSHGGLRFDVHVAPRLIGDGVSDTLGRSFPDFADWPAVTTRLTVALTVDPGGTALTVPARLVSSPDSQVWKAMFTSSTPVRSAVAPKTAGGLRIGSYPIRHVVRFLSRQWGLHGASSGCEFPRFDDLIASPLMQLAFEDEGREHGVSGSQRRAELLKTLRARYEQGHGVVRSSMRDLDDEEAIALAFLQVGDFHNGVLPPPVSDPDPDPSPPRDEKPRRRSAAPDRDFHEAVALAASHGPLQRLLGLVLEYETAPDPALTAALDGPLRTDRRLTLTVGVNTRQITTVVAPTVVGLLGSGRFEATPKTAGIGAGLIRFAADTYSVTCVDPDAGAQSATQFAATLTRSHITSGPGHWTSRGPATPENFSLPSLRTGPMTVAKDNRAADLADRLTQAQGRHAAWHDQTGDAIPADQELYAEDLVRGLRWDVRDGTDGPWRSLMRREGRYELLRLNGRSHIPVSDEAAVVTATTNGKDDKGNDVPGDHLLTESMMSWSGWSLAVEPLTRPIGTDNTPQDPAGDVDPTYQFGTSFAVPPGSLPRLRFGHSYQFRARTVDLGNGGTPATEDDLGDADAVTPAATFLRYDPVEAPAVLLRYAPGPAEGPLYAVVHEDRPISARHVVPPRSAQSMAEWHGVLDGRHGGAPDPRTWSVLSRRDAADLSDLSVDGGEDPHTRPAFYPDDEVDPPYLSDVLARAALVRGLPGPTTEQVLDFDGPWPDLRSFRVDLLSVRPGDAAWRSRDRVLEVGLEPGDIYRLRISSRFDPDDLDLMGVWGCIESSAAEWNARHDSGHQIDVDTLRQDGQDGKLWTLTPSRDLMLVHAVRTPLHAPGWITTAAGRTEGAVAATITATVEISQKSTATLDILGTWQAPVDNGPGIAPDPSVPQQFQGTAFSVRVNHPEGPAPDVIQLPVTGVHHFPDTRYRRVSYTALATSPFAECFREESAVRLSGARPLSLPDGTDPATVRVRDASTGAVFALAGSGETDPATASGDFLIDPEGPDLYRTAGGRIASGGRVVVSIVRGPLTRLGAATQVDVLSSARPAPPRIRYVVPAFAWDDTVPGTSRRLGGGLRVYLERPWWSSGDGELLGVVLLSDPKALPSDDLRPYVTTWGSDPTTGSAPVVDGPALSSFPLAKTTAAAATVPELGSVPLDVAGHAVAFDAARDLWYADLRLTGSDGQELAAYLPFVRLALVRFQPNALDGCHLSTVQAADFVQLANGRSASVAMDGSDYVVTVSGHAAAVSGQSWSHAVAFVETRTALADPDLGWEQAGPAVELAAPPSADYDFTWTGRLPRPDGHHRIVVQEYEPRSTGSTDLRRVVYTDILDPS